MSSRYGPEWWPEAKPPRPVKDGLKARTARGPIGESWWSRRFLEVLESFALGTRLTRGRTYARKGQVISLDVAAGEVSARVQGSRARPYAVRIGLDPFPELVWAKTEVALAESALVCAKLLAGEVPPELEETCATAGAPLFPRTVRELHQSCSCPDVAVPCKHLAATFYLLAEAFDADPFLLLRWRGRDRDILLQRLRMLRGDGEAIAEAGAAPTPVGVGAGAGLVVAGLELAAPEPDRYWLPAPPLPRQPATLETDPDLVLQQLPVPAAALGGEALVTRLRGAYERFGVSPASDPRR